ncbi:hypothetical protein CCAE64S_01144 [Castellaniella caeni]
MDTSHLARRAPPRSSALPLDGFASISLAQLEARARLMHRHDLKFVLPRAVLLAFLAEHQTQFDILEIDGKRLFRYQSIYFDSTDLQCWHDHNQGRRRRAKFRYRQYLDHGTQYLEVKLKGLRNVTHKHRVAISATDYQACNMPDALQHFCHETVRAAYPDTRPMRLQRTLGIDYERCTLVARTGVERITIDGSLCFFDQHRRHPAPADRWIIEIKSDHRLPAIAHWMFQHHQRAIAHCSKYGMGAHLLKLPQRNSRFAVALRRHLMPSPDRPT